MQLNSVHNILHSITRIYHSVTIIVELLFGPDYLYNDIYNVDIYNVDIYDLFTCINNVSF